MLPALRNLREGGKGGLAFRLSLFILTATAFIFLTAFGYSYFYSRKQILANVEKNAEAVTMATVSKIEVVLEGVEKVPSYLARNLQGDKPSLPVLQQQIIALLQTNPEIFGSAVAYEPYAYEARSTISPPISVGVSTAVWCLRFWGTRSINISFWTGISFPRSWTGPSGANPISTKARET